MTTALGVVLAGGASRRMGTDKAFVDVHGRAMVERVADALSRGGCRSVVCQGGDGRRTAAIGLGTWPDVVGPPGPVGAIRSAVDRVVTEFPDVEVVVVAACDLPFLDGGVVTALVDAAAATGRVAVASTDGRIHLVVGVPVSMAPFLGEAECSSFRCLVADLPSVEVEVAESAVVNVNTPSDLPGGDRQGHAVGSPSVVSEAS
ncbi:MAG: hypothetical protein RLZZ01_1241 [Actinomycetota bacterium]